MRRLLTTLASVALVVGLAAPVWADNAHQPAGAHFSTLDNEDQRPHCFRRYDADCDRERREHDRNAQRDDNGY
jgi:hypothetical protein